MAESGDVPSYGGKLNWIERRPVPIDFGGPDRPYDVSVGPAFESEGGIAVVEAAAGRFPDQICVDDGKLRLTFSEFLDRVYGLAHRLMDEGAPRIVASLVQNSSACPIIIMATVMAGRILVAIDATHPLERQTAIFEESGAGAVIIVTGEAVDDSFIPAEIQRFQLDPAASTGAGRPSYRYDPDAPLSVNFTSGSTKRPKGIVSGGRYGAAALRSFVDMFHIGPGDVILGLASLSTGGSRDAFAAIASGAKIRIVDVRAVGIGEALRVMATEGVTILSFIPSALRAILSIDGAERAFHSLRVLDLHGERILASDIALFRAKLPPVCRISITMGSVEAGPVFSWFVQDDKIDGANVPVGYLMPGRAVALLDEAGDSATDGETGELVVRGPMALGAWSNGRQVAGPFLPDPDDSGSRIYPMGDLVRQRPDGLFEFIERRDRRVKIRGLWADLGQVESALRTVSGVTDAVAVIATRDGEADRIVAFVSFGGAAPAPTMAVLRRAVAEEAADQMVPSEIRVLEAVPRLANFKPDLVRLTALIDA